MEKVEKTLMSEFYHEFGGSFGLTFSTFSEEARLLCPYEGAKGVL
ncbi:unnamed protein product [Brassica napus]|nr:unnamed protein product [Brassica napus]